ncbi:MAG: ribonuclease III [Patescibacteria group bacterium]|nr:ribonuclease III [Patescibacteria group bacterium]
MNSQKHDFTPLEKLIGISFSNRQLLENVFVHRSFLNENKNYHLSSNEKLEFLGDSVLSLITSIYLFKHYHELSEGDYTDIKASIVRTESLAEAAAEIGLGSYLLLSKGEEKGNGRRNSNILADTFEALVACIFIEHGFEQAYNFVRSHLFKEKLDTIVKNKLYMSPKSRLQEIVQARHKILPTYKVTEETGPEHSKTFTVSVYIADSLVGTGTGTSKKMAEEAAAKKALEKELNF